MSEGNGKRPLEDAIVDAWDPSDPQLSPDGRWVAWVASPHGKKGEHPESNIWLAPADGSEMGRQFSFGESQDSSPRWAPDGKSIAFLSDRAERGTSGLYLLPVDGGEARQLVQRKSAIQAFDWSPDGRSLAFLSADEPTDEDKRREEERDDPDVYGEKWPYARLRVLDVASGEVRDLPSGDRHLFELAWSPDGARIAFLASPTPELDTRTENAVFTIGLEESEPALVCSTNRMAGRLVWSHDGGQLAFLAGHDPTISALTAHTVDSAGGDPRVIGPSDSEEACGIGLRTVPGESRLMIAVAQGLGTRLEWVDPTTGDRESFYEPPEGDVTPEFSVVAGDGTGHLLSVIHSSGQQPPEVETGTRDRRERVSDHHAPLSGFTFGTQEPFYWTAPDGTELDGVLIRPPDAGDEPLPLIVHIHGGPYGRYAMGWNQNPRAGWQQWMAVHGYAVLMPNYRGGMGRGNAFARSLLNNITDREFDDIMSGVDAAIERGIADPERLGVGGWSGGGLLTAWIVGHTHRFKAGIMGAGVTYWGAMAMDTDMYTVLNQYAGDAPWDGAGPHRSKQHSPISFARDVQTPLLIVHGKDDARVPVNQATGFHRALRDAGATTEMVLYPREQHPILERNHQHDMLCRVRDWFQKWV